MGLGGPDADATTATSSGLRSDRPGGAPRPLPRASPAFALLPLLPLAAIWAHVSSPSFGGANKCVMTYMYPGYFPVRVDRGMGATDPRHEREREHDHGYSLHVYRERPDPRLTAAEVVSRLGSSGSSSGGDGAGGSDRGRERRRRRHRRVVPGLFLPGNGGSYRQVRSIAAESARVADARKRRRRSSEGGDDDDIYDVDVDVDWFTVDFNEELSAFHGGLLARQTAFARDCLSHVLSLYPPDTHVFVAGAFDGIT